MEPKTAIEIKEKVLKIFNTHQSERERLLGEILEICNLFITEEVTEENNN